MANPLVIDLSHWQPDPIDWAAMRNNGTVGVIFKATEGTGYIDPTWVSRAKAALAAGLKVSTYHFMRPGNIEGQMMHYLDEQNKLMPLGSRVCLDHEDAGVSLADLEEAIDFILVLRP